MDLADHPLNIKPDSNVGGNRIKFQKISTNVESPRLKFYIILLLVSSTIVPEKLFKLHKALKPGKFSYPTPGLLAFAGLPHFIAKTQRANAQHMPGPSTSNNTPFPWGNISSETRTQPRKQYKEVIAHKVT
eukprot:jgi/Botrbrau1/2588/Bobra.145_1s0015.1